MEKIISNVIKVEGSLKIPPSKSHAQRVLACALISQETTLIKNFGNSDDELAVFQLIKDAGARVLQNEDEIKIQGIDFKNEGMPSLNINESGLATRMLTPILANFGLNIELTGKGSILKRPMGQFDELMTSLGVDFQSNQGKLPFQMKGPLIPKSIQIDGSLSSQFVTGLILGYIASPLLRNEIIEVINPTSIPYIELTFEVLREFGVDLKFENNKIQFSGPYNLKETEISIEGDWSSASFFLVAAAINGDIQVDGLNLNSKQADRKLLKALKDFGATINFGDGIRVSKNETNAFTFDATHCPDLFPPLAVLASFAKGISKIKGVNRLKHKESDRASTIQSELTKMGAKVQIVGDEMIINGIDEVHPAMINPHGDHRIAMAAGIMALSAQSGSVVIQNSEVVKKSFPDFFECLEQLNCKIL
jgi:3-phosphoshikimate 1-carboxyvinyltransferase